MLSEKAHLAGDGPQWTLDHQGIMAYAAAHGFHPQVALEMGLDIECATAFIDIRQIQRGTMAQKYTYANLAMELSLLC